MKFSEYDESVRKIVATVDEPEIQRAFNPSKMSLPSGSPPNRVFDV